MSKVDNTIDNTENIPVTLYAFATALPLLKTYLYAVISKCCGINLYPFVNTSVSLEKDAETSNKNGIRIHEHIIIKTISKAN